MNISLKSLKAMPGALSRLNGACRKTNRSLNHFGRTVLFVRVAPVYAATHGGALPGSLHTARLRKKRIDAVLLWWDNWNPAESPQDAP